jgi:hypothetical protein
MNCDHVFDLLTRGPFPTGASSDSAVESHLLACGECRQLAEALRPALELFEEAVTVEESRTLPGYWGNLHTGSESQVALAPPDRDSKHTKLSGRLLSVAAEHATEIDWWRIAAALLLGVLLGSWFRAAAWNDVGSLAGGPRSSTPNLQLLASMSLPSSCLKRTAPDMLQTADLSEPSWQNAVQASDFACCTSCHASGDRKLSRTALSTVALSCRACHE